MSALTTEQQIEAGKLYNSGLSAQQIAMHFNVGLDATFYALKRQKIPRRTSAESNRLRFESEPSTYFIKENLTPEEEEIKLAAIMLYWAEGYKVGGNCIDFANSDPEMALLFRVFLRRICNVDESKLRCALYCYEGQDIEAIIEFWSNLLEIPKEQFTKPYIKKGNPGVRGPRMTHGLVHVRYCDTKLLRQLLAWIEEYSIKVRRWRSGQSRMAVTHLT